MATTPSVLIFAGAGASKAVNSARFPTTVEFMSSLPETVTSDVSFQLVSEYLTNVEKLKIHDIESILWNLQRLAEFYRSTHSPIDIVSYSIFGNHLRSLTGHSVSPLQAQSELVAGSIDKLVDNINEVLYRVYDYEPEDREIESNWSFLLRMLSGAKIMPEIFTTNYDTVIENALQVVDGDDLYRRMLGLHGRRRVSINLLKWGEAASSVRGMLTKLHGSLDWKLDGDDIVVGDALFTGTHSRQAIIYPGFKGASKAPFFSAFHSYFARRLADATTCIFLGFAFRDEHINDLIRENLNDEAKVLVINPAKKVKFPISRRVVHYAHFGFDEKSVDWIIEKTLT